MNGKLTLALLLLVVAMLGPSATAQALCGQNLDCGPGTTTTHSTVQLTVAAPSRGSVTGDAGKIACGAGGADCSENYTATTTCTDAECTTTGPSVTLTGSAGAPGFTPDWTGCSSASGSTCSLTMDTDHNVSLTWTDEADPTVGLSTPASKAGPSTVFTATASDNSGVVNKVDFYVDDVLRVTDTSAPYQYKPDISTYADGSLHTLKVIAQDGSARISSGLASAPSAGFTVDRSTAVTDVSTPAASTESAPDVTFSVPADATSVVCRTKAGDTVVGSTSNCSSPYSPQGVTADGPYTVEIAVIDDVGNSATVARAFTLHHAVADKPANTGGAGGISGTGAPNGTSGTAASAGTAPSGTTAATTAPTVTAVTLSTSWRRFGKRTRVDRLTLAGVPKGAKVTVTCKGKGCAFTKKTLTGTGKNLALAGRFKRRKLAAKTVITVTVATATGTKRFRYTLRAGKVPKQSIR